MRHLSLVAIVLASAAPILGIACGGTEGNPNNPNNDAGADTGTDAQPQPDAGPDVQPPPPSPWPLHVGGTGFDGVQALVVAGDGSIFVAGGFEGKVTIGDKTLESAGNMDAYVARLTPDAKCTWALRMGGADVDEMEALAIGADGDIYATGRRGFKAGTTGNVQQIMVTKLAAADGAERWSKTYGAADGLANARSIAVDGGAVVIGGAFEGKLAFGATELTSAGKTDGFFARLDAATGDSTYAHRIGGAEKDAAARVAIKGDRVLVLGQFMSTAQLGDAGGADASLTSRGEEDTFLAAYASADGAFQAARHLGGENTDFAVDLAIDGQGNIALVGATLSRELKIGDKTVTRGIGQGNPFYVAKLDKDLAPQTLAVYGGAGMKLAALGAATFDAEGQLFLAGGFEGKARFGEIDPPADGDEEDVFLARIATDGKVAAAARFGGKGEEKARAAGVSGGQILLGGTFQGKARLGGKDIDAVGAFDAFVLSVKR